MSLPSPARSTSDMPFLSRKLAEAMGYIIRRWYPDSVFLGERYAASFDAFDRKHGDDQHRAAAVSLISAVHGSEQPQATVTIGNLIHDNQILGDWELVVRRKGHEEPAQAPEAAPEKDEAKAAALTILNTVAASGAQRTRVRIDGAKWEGAPDGTWTLTVEKTPQIQEKTS